MDEISLRLRNQTQTIERVSKLLQRRYRSLAPNEVYACTLMGAWRALQKQDAGLTHSFGSILWYAAMTECGTLLDWYTARQKRVSFIDEDIVLEDLDSPELLLEAQQIHDHLESLEKPLRGLLEETMDGLGISRTEAKRQLQRAKAALGYQPGNAGTRYTDDQKKEILNYLGIPTSNRVDPSNPIENFEGRPPVSRSSGVAAVSS